MVKSSAGLILYRRRLPVPEVLLVHPGGPFWAKKDHGAWSIPKGLYEPTEDSLVAARREFEEETGCKPPHEASELGVFKQPSGKSIVAWTAEGDFDLALFRSNLFSLEWPPKSGKVSEFPEADRAGWFGPAEALKKVTKGQVAILRALFEKLDISPNWLVDDETPRFDKKGQASLF